MAGEQGKSSSISLLDGHYHGAGTWYSFIIVKGGKAILKDPTGATYDLKVKVGNLGEADPDMVKTTGQEFYNIEFTYNFGNGNDLIELGMISADGLKITMKSMAGVAKLEWVTEEEMAAIEEDGDPIEAPPGPYKVQPDNLGKLLWITGAPGLGKSTSAQLLGRSFGYVYYEADCFGACKNPYIPVDVPNPSMAVMHQKPLKGDGLEERAEAIRKSSTFFFDMMAGKEYDIEMAKEFYGLMSEDIKRERKRIGGDWAIAAVTLSRDLRNHIRSILGPDLVFVVMDMELEDVRKRVATRHSGHEGAVEMLTAINKLCEPATEDEENAVSVMVTNEMTKEDVVNKILELVN